MEKKSKFTKKLINLFWGFIGAFPIIFLLINILTLWLTNTRYTVNVDTWTTTDFKAFLQIFPSYTIDCLYNVNTTFNFLNGTLSNSINKFIRFIIDGQGTLYQTPIVIYTSYVITWYIVTQLIHIIVDFIMLLPNICKKLIRKAGGDYE